MKKILFIGLLGLIVLQSCDKVENAYDPYLPSTDLNYDLYPDGGEQEYLANEWPTFTANTNTDRNVLIEDYTGHKCTNCPDAAVIAHDIKDANPDRAIITSIHTTPDGDVSFISTEAAFPEDFTCPEGLEIGLTFGNPATGSSFYGLPYGSISRDDTQTGFPVEGRGTWASTASNILTTNDLKVNLQAHVNYFPSKRGVFLHTEIDVLDAALTNDLFIVTQLIEDSLISPQKMPDNSINNDYVHRDIMRGTLDGRTFGQLLDVDHLDANGKYYFNYSYRIPDEFNDENVHLVIYVRDAVTEEVYQVIEAHLQ